MTMMTLPAAGVDRAGQVVWDRAAAAPLFRALNSGDRVEPLPSSSDRANNMRTPAASPDSGTSASGQQSAPCAARR
jgi:hypothetical protein